jgi:uncharacterized protein
MDVGCISVPFEVKFATSGARTSGSFEGYGAVFNNQDSHGDVIEPGAFRESLAERERQGRPLPSMYKMHGAVLFPGNKHEPIGVWDEMSEDTRGLHVKGHLIGLDTEEGKWNLAQLRERALRGLSIGYGVPPHGAKMGSGKPGEPKRYLKTLNLREVSLVDDPSNSAAWVTHVKRRAGGDDVSGLGVIRGYATRHGKRIVSQDGTVLMFSPGCFAHSIASSRPIRLLIDHDEEKLVTTSNGSLRLHSDHHGIAFHCELPSTKHGHSALDLLNRNNGHCAMSIGWREIVGRNASIEGLDVRVVEDADVYEITISERGLCPNSVCVLVGNSHTLPPLHDSLAMLSLTASAEAEQAKRESLHRLQHMVRNWNHYTGALR